MQTLTLLVQPTDGAPFAIQDVIAQAKAIGRYPELDKDMSSGMTALTFFSENLSVLWDALNGGLLHHPELGAWMRDVCIVVCESEEGEELLLYHYDPEEVLDSL